LRLPVPPGGKKIESRGNLKGRRTFKSSAEDSKQLEKIENCGRKFKSQAERWAFRRKFETATEQLKSPAEKSILPLKICDVRGKFKSPVRLEGERLRRRFELPRENLNFQRTVEGASGKLRSSAED
jgi:hypothetical protein